MVGIRGKVCHMLAKMIPPDHGVLENRRHLGEIRVEVRWYRNVALDQTKKLTRNNVCDDIAELSCSPDSWVYDVVEVSTKLTCGTILPCFAPPFTLPFNSECVPKVSDVLILQ